MRSGGALRFAALAALIAIALLAGCRKRNTYAPPPPAEVGVAPPLVQTVTPYLDATGTSAAYNQVTLEARVQGFVKSIDYKDGDRVKAGKLLFVIEPEPYQAKLQQAQSQLASAQAQFRQADVEYRRQAALGKTNVATQSAVDQAKATRDTDEANVTNAEAGVAIAAINLSYTRVTAPFSGVVTNHLVSVGALVGVSGPTDLASLVQLSPVYVNFTLSEAEVQRIRSELARSGRTLAELGKIRVDVGLITDTGYPFHGALDYAAPQVDTATGTLSARAVLPNTSRTLLPGYFVRVRIPLVHMAGKALLVPDAAIGTSQAGRYVLVVDKNDMVESRKVEIGALYGAWRVITSGLKPEDRVVVTGLTRATPGSKVAPKQAKLPPPPKSAD